MHAVESNRVGPKTEWQVPGKQYAKADTAAVRRFGCSRPPLADVRDAAAKRKEGTLYDDVVEIAMCRQPRAKPSAYDRNRDACEQRNLSAASAGAIDLSHASHHLRHAGWFPVSCDDENYSVTLSFD